MSSRIKTSSPEKTLRWGVVFLIFLFIVLWLMRVFLFPAHIENQTIKDAYGLSVINQILDERSPLRTHTPRQIKYIVIHETGNPAPTATASAHARYLEDGGNGSASWHYTVDDTVAYHHIPDDEVAYHAGKGNRHGIGIELCVNSGGDFEQTFENGAKLTAKLIDVYGLSVNDIKQHGDFMLKNCPENIRNTQRWGEFINLVKKFLKDS